MSRRRRTESTETRKSIPAFSVCAQAAGFLPVRTPFGRPAYLRTFEAPAAFADYCNGRPTLQGEWSTKMERDTWHGKMSAKAAAAVCRTGSSKHADAIASYLDKLPAIDTTGRQWQASPAGGRVNVPAYLSGRPDCMLARRACDNANNPLRVIVDPSSSGGIDASDCEKRGAAIVALVSALAEIRPVILTVAMNLGVNDQENVLSLAIDVPTRPMDIGMLASLVADQACIRGLMYGASAEAGGRSGNNAYERLAWAYGKTSREDQQAVMAAIHGADLETDLILPGIFLEDPAIADPARWIAEMLEKYGAK